MSVVTESASNPATNSAGRAAPLAESVRHCCGSPNFRSAHGYFVPTFPARPPVAILGVPFDNVTTAETLARIEQMVESRKPHYLVTANVDFVVQAQTDIELRRIFADADLVLCDGTPLLWVSRLLGNPLVERVAGADIVPLLIERAAQRGDRLFFLGATPNSCRAAVERLQARYPTLLIAGHYSPPFNTLLEMDHDEIKRRITKAAPDLLFVAFGCPKAEKWLAMHYRDLGVPVAIGVGATIDFLAGQVRRAPIWMRRTGLEWVFRLTQEPRRLFRRYAKDLWVFGWRILGQWWMLRRQKVGGNAPSRPQQHPTGQPFYETSQAHLVELCGPLHRNCADDLSLLLHRIVSDARPCILNLSLLDSIDSTGIAMLMRLQQRLQAAGAPLILLGVSPSILRIFKRMRWDNFFAFASTREEAVRLIELRNGERTAAVGSFPYHGTGLAWRGEITAANVAEVWEHTQKVLFADDAVPNAPDAINGHNPEVVIDMSQVRFIDSSGLGIMVRARKWAHRHGLGLAFTGLQPAVASVVRMAQLEEFLNVRLRERAPG